MKKIYKNSILILLGAFLFCINTVTAQNLMQNSGFESGLITPWVLGGQNNGVVIEDPFEGTYAAKGHLEYYLSGFEEGVFYTWTAQTKCLAECSEKNMFIGVKDLVADTVTNFNFTLHTDYAEATVIFRGGVGEHRFFQWGQNAGEYVTDNHLLLKEGTTSTDEFEIEANKILILTNGEGVLLSIDPSIEEADVFIHDISGKLILNTQVGNGMTTIPNSKFSTTGIYPISVRTDKTIKIGKVFIQK